VSVRLESDFSDLFGGRFLAQTVFLGEDLLPWLTLAIGGALLVGTLMALIRPPSQPQDGALERPPLGRSVVQIAIGLIASIWALATLLS
jgi:hypothetical protein